MIYVNLADGGRDVKLLKNYFFFPFKINRGKTICAIVDTVLLLLCLPWKSSVENPN